MRATESTEMYLETILVLSEQKNYVRSIDVVHHTGYSKPSVSRAVGLLKKRFLIDVDSNGYITLTDDGRAAAQKILERHRILTAFFVKIGVDEETASEDACRIEHTISDLSLQKIKEQLENN